MSCQPQEPGLRPRLLIVYADPAFASRIVRSFRRLGWEVHMAAGAVEALRLIELQNPQAVLVETALPGDSGWSISARITAADPDQRVIMLAGERPSDAEERCVAAGAAALVTRTDGMESLVRAVYGQPLAKAV